MHATSPLIEGHRPIDPPPGVPLWDVDPYDPEVLASPESFYAELRELGSFAMLTRYSMLICGRYLETETVFSDNERFVSSRGVGLQDFSLEEPWRPPSLLLEADPPDHTRVRKVMTKALSPRVVATLKEMFQQHADALVTQLLVQQNFDGVKDFAEPYPTTVVPAAIGMRNVNTQYLIDYGAMVFNGIGPDNEIRQTSLAQAAEIVPWITAACTRENLDDGGIGALIHDAASGGDLDPHECAMLVRSLFSAGIDTTISGIASALWCLATQPDAFEALKADPGLSRPCFEEVIRFTSPVHSFCRTANVDTEVSGISIKEGTKILCMLGAANLDERKWPNANTFDIHRRPVGHLAFGSGIHRCVGQNIARAEAEAVLTSIAKHVNTIQLTGPASWRPNNGVHGLAILPLRFT